MNTTQFQQRLEITDAIVARLHEFDSTMAAARSLCDDHPELFPVVENARGSIKSARKRAMNAARKGAGTHQNVAEGFAVKGTTTLYKDGEEVLQWVKTTEDSIKQRQIIEESFDAMANDLPRLDPAPVPEMPSEQANKLCNLYTITDAHLGVMVSLGEGGEEYDLQKGEDLYRQGFDALIMGAPRAKRCVISQLGDFLHSDGLDAVTPRSQHPLDQSHRFQDVVRAATRLLRHMIDTALVWHDEVELIIAEGNHDLASSLWLRVMFENVYENEPRLKIIHSDLPFYATTHGDVMLGFHHGHIANIKAKASANSLALRFASGDEWSKTKKRYIHTGHHHDEAVTEVCGAKLFAHPTLAAPDAYASRNFGGSMREMTTHTYHAQHGKVGTNTVTPEMLN